MQALISLGDRDYLESFVEELSDRYEGFPTEEAQGSLQNNDFSGFLLRVLDFLLEAESASSGEYVVTFSALNRIENPEEFKKTIDAVVELGLSGKNGFAVMVRVLLSALNTLPMDASRLPLFLAILKLAEREGKLVTMPQFLTHAHWLAKEWQLPPA